jgi:hypothetical protein
MHVSSSVLAFALVLASAGQLASAQSAPDAKNAATNASTPAADKAHKRADTDGSAAAKAAASRRSNLPVTPTATHTTPAATGAKDSPCRYGSAEDA